MSAGYADVALQSMLRGSQFVGKLHSEDALDSTAWQSFQRERWQGSLIVFTVRHAVAADPLQAGLARIQLARLVQLLRYLLTKPRHS